MTFRKIALVLATLSGFAAVPAQAALNLGTTNCANTDITPTASACRGWYTGNLNSGNATDLNDSATAVNMLLGTTYTGSTLPILETLGSLSGNVVNFSNQLYGLTVVSFHVGGARGEPTGVGYNATAFYAFDAGTTGLDTLGFNRAGLSNARLFVTSRRPPDGVPEPSTWAMLVLGFGLLGGVMRRSRAKAAEALVAA